MQREKKKFTHYWIWPNIFEQIVNKIIYELEQVNNYSIVYILVEFDVSTLFAWVNSLGVMQLRAPLSGFVST